jgi:hypothetical protein
VFNAAADAMKNNEQLDAQMARQGLFDIESMIPDVTDVQLNSQIYEPEDDADTVGAADSDYEEADESEPLQQLQTLSYNSNGSGLPQFRKKASHLHHTKHQ